MKRFPLPFRMYLLAAAALTLCATILRTLALTTAFDADIGYFREGSPLVTAFYIIEGIALLAAFSLPFFVKRGTLPTGHPPLSLASLIATGIATLAAIAMAAILIAHIAVLSAPAILSVLCLFLLLATAIFFGFQFLAQNPPAKTLLLCGYGVILAAACLLSITYFDLYTPMNAPHKFSLHLALLSLMLYMLFELRILIGRPRPRGLGVLSAICFFLCATTGISNTIAFLAGIYNDVFALGIDLLLIAFALYVGTRAVDPFLAKED